MKHSLLFTCSFFCYLLASAQPIVSKKDTLLGRAGKWADYKTFVANDGTRIIRAPKESTTNTMGYDIVLPPDNEWSKEQKEQDENAKQFDTDIQNQIPKSPELKYWSKEFEEALKIAKQKNDIVLGKTGANPLSSSQPPTPAPEEKSEALKVMSQWAKEHCDEIHKVAAFLERIKNYPGKKEYVQNYPVAPQPPQFDFLEVCNECHPEVRRSFDADFNRYNDDYINKYLKDPIDAIIFILKAQQVYSGVARNGFSKKETDGEPCLADLDNSRIPLSNFEQVHDVLSVISEITQQKFFKEYKDYEKMHQSLLFTILRVSQLTSNLDSKENEYAGADIEVVVKLLDRIIDEWKKRLNAGDIRMLAVCRGILEVERLKSNIGGSKNYQDPFEVSDLIAKNLIVKTTIEADVKVTGENEQKNYSISHVKGDGYMGIKVDSVRCMWLEPVENNNGQFVSLARGGITMNVIAGEMFARGENGQPDSKSNIRSPQKFDITPRINFDMCGDRDQKHYFIFDYLGPDPSKYTEFWTSIDKPVKGALNAPFMLAFKSEDFTVDESETRDEIENAKDSLDENKGRDMAELKKVAADFQAKKISYQQFMAIQKRITDKVMNNIEKLKEAAVYVKVPVDLSPEKGFFINQRIDAKSINPGKKEIVYGYLTIQLKPNK